MGSCSSNVLTNACKHRRSKKGVVTKMFAHQKANSVMRGHLPPSYTKEDLREWLYSQSEFHILFDNWVRLGYSRNNKPSVDRIDDRVGYTMNNIQLTTALQNTQKKANEMKMGVGSTLVAVIQYTMEDEKLAEYPSLHVAGRLTNIAWQNISKVCRNVRTQAGGYKWKYKKEIKC